MDDRFGALRRAHEETVFTGPGKTDPALRRAIAEGPLGGAGIPEDLRSIVDKIERSPHEVTDDDLDRLKARYSEDEIFEIVVTASLASSSRRLRAGLAALEAA